MAVPDATVLATPLYFATMEAERRYLQRRSARVGPTPADYTVPDTRTSLTMGVGSLVLPLLTTRLLRGKGKKLLVLGLGAAAVTTVADRAGERGAPVARIAGPVAVGAGWLAAATTLTERWNPAAQWRKGRRRDLGSGPLAWFAAIAGWDLVYYWNHRLMHEVRGLWAYHVVHHSSERYNLSTALRQPVADGLGIFVPYGLLSRFGVRPSLVAHARGINLLYQYWIHTDVIRSLGTAEELLNTPSHHRVHHGSNRKYLDRNHGSILIVWDRLFGTFQREEEPVVYGLTRNIRTENPVKVATHEWVDIVKDVSRSTTWRDRLSHVLRGPGWGARSTSRTPGRA